MAQINILSIDGGGIRGVIPALILQQFEKRLGASIASTFDLIAGTSTGGILTLGLTADIPGRKAPFGAADLVSFYRDKGASIFSDHWWRPVTDLGRPEFSADGLTAALQETFGDAQLKDTLTHVLVPAYDLRGVDLPPTPGPFTLVGGTPVFFSNDKAKADPRFNFYVRDVARATSAAPTYFPTFRLAPVGSSAATDQDEWLEPIDGGVFANNPAMCAYCEALGLFQTGLQKGDNSYVIASLGTGELNLNYSLDAAINWGKLQWIQPVLDIMMDGASGTVHHQLTTVFPYAEADDIPPSWYCRLQPTLDAKHSDLGNASPENIADLEGIATRFIQDNDLRIQRLCSALKRRTPLPSA
jgi:uncharacterized protein